VAVKDAANTVNQIKSIYIKHMEGVDTFELED